MKILLLLALCLWAVIHAHHTPEHSLNWPPFHVGKTHRYELVINMTAGIPGHTSQLAKSVIWTDISIWPKTETEYLLKFDNVRIGESKPAVQSNEEYISLRRTELESELSTPIKFKLVDGEIKYYTMDDSWTNETQSLKKSILRHLQVKFRENPELRDKDYKREDNPELYPYCYVERNETEIGPIEDWYVVGVVPYPDFPYEQNVYNISKTRNYDAVGYLSAHSHHNFAKRGCPEVCRREYNSSFNIYGAGCPVGYEPNNSPLKKYYNSHYNLRLWQGKMIFESIHAEEKQIASTYDQDMVVTIRSHYRLKDISDKRIEEPKGQTEYYDFDFEPTPAEYDQNEREYWTDIYHNFQKTDLTVEAERLLEDIKQTVIHADLESHASQEVGEKLIVLQRIFSFFKKVHFDSIWRKAVEVSNYRKAPEEEKVWRQIFLDLLPLVGTDESLKFIKYLITEKKVSTWEATDLLVAVPENLIDPDETNIRDIYELLSLSHVQRHHMLHSAAHLTLSKVIRKACIIPSMMKTPEENDERKFNLFEESYKNMRPQSWLKREIISSDWLQKTLRGKMTEKSVEKCPQQLTAKYMNEIVVKLRSRSIKMQEKVIYIEALAHVGTEKVIPTLLPYIHGTANDLDHYSPGDKDFLKTVTLYSMHNIVAFYPFTVLYYVSPVYFNKTEVARVRIAAFSLIMRAHPPLSLLKHMALDSWNEPSREVGSYVYTSMQTFGNSSLPCMKLTARRIRMVMSQFKNYHMGRQHAKSITKTFYDEVRNFGIEGRFSTVPSNESVVPHSLYASLSYNIDNLKDIFFQWAMNIQGVGEEEFLNIVDVAMLGFKWPKNIPKEKEGKIFGNLEIVQKLPKELRFTLYKKLFYSSCYIYADKESFWSTIEPLVEHFQNVFTERRGAVKGHYIKIFIPSSYHAVGYFSIPEFPSEFLLKHPVLFSLKVETLSHRASGKAVAYYLRPSMYYTKHVSHHIVNMIDHKVYGVYHEQKYSVSLPFHLYLSIDEEANTWRVTFKLPELPKRVMRYHSEAGTYAGPAKLNTLVSSTHREPIKTLPTLYEKETVFGVPMFPPVYVTAHTEDILDGYDEVPRNFEEAMALAVKYIRNPGWKRKALNATIVKKSGKPIDEMTFEFSYNTTAKYPSNENKQNNEWYAPRQSERSEEELEKESASSEMNTPEGLKPYEAEKIYNKIVNKLPHFYHEFEINFETKPSYNKANVRFEYNHTFDKTQHAWNLRTHMNLEGKSPYHICWAHVTAYKNLPNEFKYDLKKYGLQKASYYSAFSFKDCKHFSNPDVHITGSMYFKPHETLFDENEFSEHPKRDWFLPETHEECVRDVQEGKPLSIACKRAIKEEAVFNKYNLRVQWINDIPEIFKNITYKVEEAIKYAYYSHVDINRMDIKNRQDHLDISIDYINKLVDRPVVNVYIRAPKENINFYRVPVKYMQPFSSIYDFHETYIKEFTNNTYPSTCSLMEKYVQTFDLKTFKLPLEECTYVLAAHCVKNKKFTVLAKPLRSNLQKEVTLYVGNNELILRPAQRKGIYTIEYNHHEYPIDENTPEHMDHEAGIHAFVIPVTDKSQFKPGMGKYILAVHADNVGIKIFYDGWNAKLEVHPFYKGQLCGLCSEFDGEVTREYRGVDQCLYADSKDFAYSSVINAEKCGINVNPKHGKYCPYSTERNSYQPHNIPRSWPSTTEYPYTDEEIHESAGISMPKLRTYHVKRGEYICFSTQPITLCDENVEPLEKEWKTVDFHCLPKQDSTTRRLVIESKNRILRELASKSVDFTEEVAVHKTCSS